MFFSIVNLYQNATLIVKEQDIDRMQPVQSSFLVLILDLWWLEVSTSCTELYNNRRLKWRDPTWNKY